MQEQREGREEEAFSYLARNFPEYMEPLNQIHVLVNSYAPPPPGSNFTMTVKEQELVAAAVLAAQRDWERFKPHVRRALQHASMAEIAQVLMVAAQMSGSPAIRTGVQIMLDIQKEGVATR
jgi:alkylhydroperoxidase/carboxymuconolactone decarboxylase family protein YurZ